MKTVFMKLALIFLFAPAALAGSEPNRLVVSCKTPGKDNRQTVMATSVRFENGVLTAFLGTGVVLEFEGRCLVEPVIDHRPLN